MDDKSKVLNFIKKHKLAVLSTVNNESLPQSSVVGFGETDNLELVFGTSNNSRKYKNLVHNPKVSLVIGWDENITIQFEGEASLLDGEEIDKYAQLYFEKTPIARKYKDLPDEVYFKVIPKWIRYTDLNKNPWEIIELKF